MQGLLRHISLALMTRVPSTRQLGSRCALTYDPLSEDFKGHAKIPRHFLLTADTPNTSCRTECLSGHHPVRQSLKWSLRARAHALAAPSPAPCTRQRLHSVPAHETALAPAGGSPGLWVPVTPTSSEGLPVIKMILEMILIKISCYSCSDFHGCG